MIDKKTIENVIDTVRIYDVVKEDVELKPSGTGYVGLCPFHNDHSPSFHVSPSKNICKCFSCGMGGTPVTYYQKKHGVTFSESIRAIAKMYDIEVSEKAETEEEKHDRIKREHVYALHERIMSFYSEQLSQSPEVVSYLTKRFGEDFQKKYSAGYAPPSRSLLYDWAVAHHESIEELVELGWLKYSQKEHSYQDKLTQRVIFPIRDVYSNIVGYTARTMSTNGAMVKNWKYINSPDSWFYRKSDYVFGLDTAKTQGKSQGIFYLVEGACDALKMQSVGIDNTVAALGGEWSDAMFRLLRRYSDTLCFINDADPVERGKNWGTGIDFVLKNGRKAIIKGFNVTVKELATKPGNEKQDPGDYFTEASRLGTLEESDFITWYAGKHFSLDKSMSRIKGVMKDVCEMLACISDDADVEYTLKELNKIHNGKNIWKRYLGQARQDRQAEMRKGQSKYEEYGFVVRGGCYYGNKGNTDGEWSNFTLTSLFHIKDNDMPRRIFSIRNVKGEEDIVDFTMDELCSMGKMKQKLEGLGNYMWMTTESNFSKVKRYLFDNTEVAMPIKQMGWHKHGFYAFGNTVWSDGKFHNADEYGMCTLDDGTKWYIPAASPIYRDNEMYYELEKRFIYQKLSDITAKAFMDEFVQVFGDNGMFGLCFYVASLFHDVVKSTTRKFPILNLCGPKGTGKTEMGTALMSFFGSGNKAPNLRNATIPALNNDISLVSNALFHVDEYKNTLKPELIEFLKGLYDCTGRKKMAGTNYENSIMTSVKCGVIMSGQEIPTIDIALLHRCVFLHFGKSDFSQDELDRFNSFYEKYKLGVTHLNIEFLKHRKVFEANYFDNYNAVLTSIMDNVENEGLEARIIENWARIISAFLTLSEKISFPFTYEKLLQSAIEHIRMQNKQCNRNDEMAKFWKNFRFLISEGLIYERADFQIRTMTKFKPRKGSTIIFDQPKQMLILNPDRVFKHAYKAGYTSGEKPIDNDTLELYMENASEFMGKMGSVRFDKIVNGQTQYTLDSTGKRVKDQSILQGLVFNIDLLRQKYGFEFAADTVDDDEPVPLSHESDVKKQFNARTNNI